jgi:YjbE family integral membrane protein
MEIISFQLIAAVMAIILIDIVLAGDNALVIGMAANRLPLRLRQRAIMYGTFGAVAIRFVAVAFITYLFMIPGLKLVGSVLLLYIGWRLAFQGAEHEIEAKDTLWSAIGTIIMADTVMSIENAFGIAAAANGNMWLVAFGLLVSVPIIMFGATFVSRVLERYPSLVYFGSFVLFAVAFLMAFKEPLLEDWLAVWPAYLLKVTPWVLAFVVTMLQYNAAELKIHKRWLIKGNKNV